QHEGDASLELGPGLIEPHPRYQNARVIQVERGPGRIESGSLGRVPGQELVDVHAKGPEQGLVVLERKVRIVRLLQVAERARGNRVGQVLVERVGGQERVAKLRAGAAAKKDPQVATFGEWFLNTREEIGYHAVAGIDIAHAGPALEGLIGRIPVQGADPRG